MPLNFRVGLPGPFSYSTRLTGRGGPTMAEDVRALRARSVELDNADRDELFRTFGARWLVNGVIALVAFIVGGWGWAFGIALLGFTAALQVWRTRRMRALAAAAPTQLIPAVTGGRHSKENAR